MSYLNQYVFLSAEFLNSANLNVEEVLLFNPTTNRGFAVYGFAKLVLKFLDGKSTLEEVITQLEVQYELAPGQYRKEVIDFIDELDKDELIVTSPTAFSDDYKLKMKTAP